jgi:hypothetical protein
MKKCPCKGFNSECHFCSGTGMLADNIDDNPTGTELRGAVASSGVWWPGRGPKVVITRCRSPKIRVTDAGCSEGHSSVSTTEQLALDPSSVADRSSPPRVGRAQKVQTVSQKLSKIIQAYLVSVAVSKAAGVKPPAPPERIKDIVMNAGGVSSWILSSHSRKVFYIAALFAARRNSR